MSNTPNTGIPYVPQGTLDPAAGLNLSLNVIDALLQCAVISISETAPPVSNADGDLYIVAGSGGTATGAWAGMENYLARYVAEGDFWQFYEPGASVFVVMNRFDGGLYAFQEGSPGGWLSAFPGTAGAPVIVLSGDLYTLGDLTPGAWHVFTSDVTGGVTLHIEDDATTPIQAAAEYALYATGDGGLVIESDTGVNIVPPKQGSLTMETGDFAMIKRISADQYKLAGEVALA